MVRMKYGADSLILPNSFHVKAGGDRIAFPVQAKLDAIEY
jgi:hypothetical protein